MNTKDKLISALTQYDAKQKNKKDYNIYALGIYFQRAEEIAADIEAGADPRAAIVAGLSGRLADFVLRKLNLPITTKEEAYGGMVYKPVKLS